jgi:hypothetical protein
MAFAGTLCVRCHYHYIRHHTYIHHCYFTEVQKDNKTVATHTILLFVMHSFVIWLNVHGKRTRVFSYKDVERLLKEEYNADEVHAVVYSHMKAEGMTANEFFEYLNKEGVELS